MTETLSPLTWLNRDAYTESALAQRKITVADIENLIHSQIGFTMKKALRGEANTARWL